jgi:hypothetical protein
MILAAPLPGATRAASSYDPILERVLKLLPKRPLQLVVIDPNQAQPDVRRTLLTLDARTACVATPRIAAFCRARFANHSMI